ncbi:MAG: NUDIX domain-containing protein [Candidatus Aenigmarchaeota archaeon]|nr:NUDIX domain-containing protein [Candidatus Aenigmarchaeota archaeon]
MQKRDVALIILYDSEKRVLLQFRDAKTNILPLHWAFFGGAIEEGETADQAVRRECFEELDYHLKNPKLVLAQKFKEHGFEGTKYAYIEFCGDKSVLKLQEGQDWGWFKLSEIKGLKMAEHDKGVLKELEGKV